MRLRIDTAAAVVEVEGPDGTRSVPFADPEAFALVSQAWLRLGWDHKYVYRFTWLGRPIIQLPEDLVRLQELAFRAKPDVVVETGVAHGGTLVLFASVCNALDHGRVVGVDVEIRPHNREAIEAHPLAGRITLIEGSSTDAATVERVRAEVDGAERVLVLLDSDHSRAHVLAELRLYGGLVPVGSWVVVADGLMRDLAGAPRSDEDWRWNNPAGAIDDFLAENDGFTREVPAPLFDEGTAATDVTYFPGGWLRRVR
jgi:cephalosporin hydroxylase